MFFYQPFCVSRVFLLSASQQIIIKHFRINPISTLHNPLGVNMPLKIWSSGIWIWIIDSIFTNYNRFIKSSEAQLVFKSIQITTGSSTVSWSSGDMVSFSIAKLLLIFICTKLLLLTPPLSCKHLLPLTSLEKKTFFFSYSFFLFLFFSFSFSLVRESIVDTHLYIYMCVCVCVWCITHTHIYIYIYIYMCVCVCVMHHTHTHTHIYIYIYIKQGKKGDWSHAKGSSFVLMWVSISLDARQPALNCEVNSDAHAQMQWSLKSNGCTYSVKNLSVYEFLIFLTISKI